MISQKLSWLLTLLCLAMDANAGIVTLKFRVIYHGQDLGIIEYHYVEHPTETLTDAMHTSRVITRVVLPAPYDASVSLAHQNNQMACRDSRPMLNPLRQLMGTSTVQPPIYAQCAYSLSSPTVAPVCHLMQPGHPPALRQGYIYDSFVTTNSQWPVDLIQAGHHFLQGHLQQFPAVVVLPVYATAHSYQVHSIRRLAIDENVPAQHNLLISMTRLSQSSMPHCPAETLTIRLTYRRYQNGSLIPCLINFLSRNHRFELVEGCQTQKHPKDHQDDALVQLNSPPPPPAPPPSPRSPLSPKQHGANCQASALECIPEAQPPIGNYYQQLIDQAYKNMREQYNLMKPRGSVFKGSTF